MVRRKPTAFAERQTHHVGDDSCKHGDLCPQSSKEAAQKLWLPSFGSISATKWQYLKCPLGKLRHILVQETFVRPWL